MKLYGVRGWGSTIAEGLLALAGRSYEFEDVEGFDIPGPARDRLSAVNPLAQVPTLVLDDGTVMTETAAIALYLADDSSALAPPPGSPQRAKFLRLLVWVVANVYPTFTYGDYPHRWAPSAPEELKAATDERRMQLYRWLESEVEQPYVLGETFTALDVYLAVLLGWRPGAAWFEAETPKLAAIAYRARAHPLLEGVMARNFPA